MTAQTAPDQDLWVSMDVWYTVILVYLIKTPGTINHQGELELVSSKFFSVQYIKNIPMGVDMRNEEKIIKMHEGIIKPVGDMEKMLV